MQDYINPVIWLCALAIAAMTGARDLNSRGNNIFGGPDAALRMQQQQHTRQQVQQLLQQQAQQAQQQAQEAQLRALAAQAGRPVLKHTSTDAPVSKKVGITDLEFKFDKPVGGKIKGWIIDPDSGDKVCTWAQVLASFQPTDINTVFSDALLRSISEQSKGKYKEIYWTTNTCKKTTDVFEHFITDAKDEISKGQQGNEVEDALKAAIHTECAKNPTVACVAIKSNASPDRLNIWPCAFEGEGDDAPPKHIMDLCEYKDNELGFWMFHTAARLVSNHLKKHPGGTAVISTNGKDVPLVHIKVEFTTP